MNPFINTLWVKSVDKVLLKGIHKAVHLTRSLECVTPGSLI